MKIFHIITSLKIGGAESALVNLLQESTHNYTDKHFVAYFYDGPNIKTIYNLNIPLFKINGPLFKYDLFAYLKLKKIVKRIKPDIIHSALWAANIFARLISKQLNIPIICDLHSNFEHDKQIRQILEKPFINMANKYIAVSTTTKIGFEKTFNTTIKPTIILNGIDSKATRQKSLNNTITRKKVGFVKNDFIIGTVGRLVKIKRQDLLIKSFAQACNQIPNNNLKLCIIGDGPKYNDLLKLVKKVNIENKVVFTGQQIDVYKYYKLFDCFALSSSSEGLSIALLEALSFGLPIITTSNIKTHDVIKNNINGFIVTPSNNINNLTKSILKLYLNPKLLSKIKINNMELVTSKFSITQTARMYQEQYQTLKDLPR